MGLHDYKVSDITQREYDLFKQVRILNIQQVIFYLQNGVTLNDIELSEDRKTHSPVMVFLFDREDTRTAYDLWCRRKNQVFE